MSRLSSRLNRPQIMERYGMETPRLATASIAAILVWFGLLLLAGCGEVEQAEQPPEPRMESRYTSAEALIDYYNSFASIDPVVFSEYVKLLYAENDLQEQLVDRYRKSIPGTILSSAVRQRFDESLVHDSYNFTTKPNQSPARLVENSGDRAQAAYVNTMGRNARLHLVKIGDRWWISGYTLEYDPLEETDPQSMAKSEAYVGLYAAISPGLLQRLQGGEFETIQQFRTALSAAMREHMQRDPDRYRILFSDD